MPLGRHQKGEFFSYTTSVCCMSASNVSWLKQTTKWQSDKRRLDNACNGSHSWWALFLKSDNNSVQFFIIYVPSQQPQGQLQAQHSVEKNNYFMNKHHIKSKTN
jgi:hypothetical protein